MSGYVAMSNNHQSRYAVIFSWTSAAGLSHAILNNSVTDVTMAVLQFAWSALTYEQYTGWPNKNRTFLRYHIFAAI